MPSLSQLVKQIIRLIARLRKNSKLHLAYAIFYLVTGIASFLYFFIHFNIIEEKFGSALLTIAAAYIGTNFINQFDALQKDKEDITTLNYFLEDLNENTDKEDIESIVTQYLEIFKSLIKPK